MQTESAIRQIQFLNNNDGEQNTSEYCTFSHWISYDAKAFRQMFHQLILNRMRAGALVCFLFRCLLLTGYLGVCVKFSTWTVCSTGFFPSILSSLGKFFVNCYAWFKFENGKKWKENCMRSTWTSCWKSLQSIDHVDVRIAISVDILQHWDRMSQWKWTTDVRTKW